MSVVDPVTPGHPDGLTALPGQVATTPDPAAGGTDPAQRGLTGPPGLHAEPGLTGLAGFDTALTDTGLADTGAPAAVAPETGTTRVDTGAPAAAGVTEPGVAAAGSAMTAADYAKQLRGLPFEPTQPAQHTAFSDAASLTKPGFSQAADLTGQHIEPAAAQTADLTAGTGETPQPAAQHAAVPEAAGLTGQHIEPGAAQTGHLTAGTGETPQPTAMDTPARQATGAVLAAAPERGGMSLLADSSGVHGFPRPLDDPHSWRPSPDSAPLRLESFADAGQSGSFLAQFGTRFGRTVHLQEATASGAADQDRAARDLLPDSSGRFTIAVHGESGRVAVGGYDVGPKALAQLVRQHPEWEQIQRSGLRLVACDTGAQLPGDRGTAFAQELATELGVRVAAPTKRVWTTYDGVALVADPDPARPGFPLHSSQGVFRDFAPADGSADVLAGGLATEPATTTGRAAALEVDRSHAHDQGSDGMSQAAASEVDRSRSHDQDPNVPAPPRLARRLSDAAFHPAAAALGDSPDHPRWKQRVFAWSPPYTARPADHAPLVPWYGREGGGSHALGDLVVVTVGRPTDAAVHGRALLAGLRDSALTDPSGTATGVLGSRMTPRLKRDVEREVTAALETTDPREWERHLRSGLTLGDGDVVVRVRFRLTGDAEAPPARDPDPVLREFMSKYGDIAFQRADAVETSQGLGVLLEYIKGFATKVTSLAIAVRPGFSVSRETSHAVADEVQLGNRATSDARVGVVHQVRIEAVAHLPGGAEAAAVHVVGGKTVITAHPTAYGPGAPTGREVIRAANPRALERFDYALAAVDTAPIEDAFLKALMGTGRVAPHRAAEIMHSAAEEILDEKSLRDRAQAAFTDSLPTNFVRIRGFSGYTTLKAALVSVERVAESAEGGIRNDIAETTTVKHGTTHGHSVGVRIGPEFGFGVGVTGIVDVVDAEVGSRHGTATTLQGQAKTAVVHDGNKIRYKAVLRIDGRIDADRRPQRDLRRTAPVVPFHADVVGEIIVPPHQADAFEREIQRPAAPAPVPSRAGLTEQAARLAAERIGPRRRPPGLGAAGAVHRPVLYQRLLKLSAARSRFSPFPRYGLADGDHNRALFEHLRSGDPAAVHVPSDHTFSQQELESLHALQSRGRVRVFEIAGDPAGADARYRELTVTRNPPPEPTPDGIRLEQTGPRYSATWSAADRATAYAARRGYTLDAVGVSGGWRATPGSFRPNPARIWSAPGRERAPVDAIHTIADLAILPRPQGAERSEFGLVAPARTGDGLRTAIDDLRTGNGRGVVDLPSEHDILRHVAMPDEGYALNIAGHVVWGWRSGGLHDWSAEEHRHAALVDLARQAGRTGLQLVVPHGSRFEDELRGAVAALRPDGWQHSPAVLAARRDLQVRLGAARERDGAGLDDLTGEDLLGLLVTDRSVRIVDEHGVAARTLNSRETVREVRDPRGDDPQPSTGRGRIDVVSDTAVDTSLRLGEEFAIRAHDGRLLRSVAWRDDGTRTGHTRRAVHESDPRRETPEMVAGVGLGSAAVKELPRSEQIHATARSLIIGLAADRRPLHRHPAADGAQAATRRDRQAARLRYRLDKQLQLTLGTPKLRGARGRGIDTGIHDELAFAGRRYQVSVEQVLLDRRGEQIASEPGVAIDHQTKGARGGGATSERSVSAGVGGAFGVRFELPHGGTIDVGDFEARAIAGRSRAQADATASKGYSRLRAPKGEAFRPEYGARYHVTVTETTRRIDGSTRRRTLSRIVEGDGATVPALVHAAFRPADADLETGAAVSAHRAVAATIGRTSVLSPAEYRDLRAHPDVVDFGRAGTDGLHVTLGGLEGSVRETARFVISEARAAHPDVSAAAWRHPAYVAEVERVLSEGFLRSNLPRVLSRDGVPVPLPKQLRRGLGVPNHERSFTVRGFFVRADAEAGHAGPGASVENYAEYDVKQTDEATRGLDYSVSGTVSGLYRHKPNATGSEQTEAGTHRAGRARAKRGVADQVGVAAGAEFTGIVGSRSHATTQGSIDVSLLTQSGGQHFSRAHLVLEVTANRQPVDAGVVEGALGRLLRPAAYDTTAQSRRLLVENAAELSMSQTLHDDLHALRAPSPGAPGEPARLDPPPKPSQPMHLARHDAALAAGYATHLDDHAAVFHESGPHLAQQTAALAAGTGILGAIRHGLLATGLVGPEHLTDASDVWRSITHKFDTGELKTHPHDLFGTGLTHHVVLPGPLGSTTRVTVRAAAERADTDHLRSRDRAAVTFGGQALKQDGTQERSGYDVTVFASADGQFTPDAVVGLAGHAEITWSAGLERTTGAETVERDIRRAAAAVRPQGGDPLPIAADETDEQRRLREARAPMAGEGEEFAHKLGLTIEIHAGRDYPDPLTGFASTTVSASAPPPLVTLRTGADAHGAPTHVSLRTVVPRHLTESGPPPAGPSAPAPAPAVRASAPGERIYPGILEHDLAGRMQALAFPDLEHVADWAPAVTLPRAKAGAYLDAAGPSRTHAGPPRLGHYAPHTDLGARLAATLANRNVRDNAPDLFRGLFALPSPHGEPVRAAVRIEGVLRPTGPPAKYNAMTFTERATEPTFSEVAGSGWALAGSLGATTADGAAIPDLTRATRTEVETAANIGDYVEYNRLYSQTAYTYGGAVTYVLTGPHDWSVKVESARRFEGLLPEAWAAEAARDHPTRVVHPLAVPLSADPVARAGQITPLVYALPPDGQPHRLVADLNGTATADDYLRSASDLAGVTWRPVELALVHYRGQTPDRLEIRVVEPAADAAPPEDAQGAGIWAASPSGPTRAASPSLDAQSARFWAASPNGPSRAGSLPMDAHNGPSRQASIPIDAQSAPSRATSSSADPHDGPSRAGSLPMDAHSAPSRAASLPLDPRNAPSGAASPRSTPSGAASPRSAPSRAASLPITPRSAPSRQASIPATRSGSPTAHTVLREAWRETPSGLALVHDDAELPAAYQTPAHRGVLTISIGLPPAADGTYTLHGHTVARHQVASAIIDQLAASETPVPRRIYLAGDDTAPLAAAVSTENARRAAAITAWDPVGAAPLQLPAIDVIGVRGAIGRLSGNSSWSGSVSALADRFVRRGAEAPGVVVYRRGRQLPVPAHADLASLLATLDTHASLPRLARTGERL
jgi:hypothetical protein